MIFFFRFVSIVFSRSQGDGTSCLEISVRKEEAIISKSKEEYFGTKRLKL